MASLVKFVKLLTRPLAKTKALHRSPEAPKVKHLLLESNANNNHAEDQADSHECPKFQGKKWQHFADHISVHRKDRRCDHEWRTELLYGISVVSGKSERLANAHESLRGLP